MTQQTSPADIMFFLSVEFKMESELTLYLHFQCFLPGCRLLSFYSEVCVCVCVLKYKEGNLHSTAHRTHR